jgi:hypothetical protein
MCSLPVEGSLGGFLFRRKIGRRGARHDHSELRETLAAKNQYSSLTVNLLNMAVRYTIREPNAYRRALYRFEESLQLVVVAEAALAERAFMRLLGLVQKSLVQIRSFLNQADVPAR